MTWGEGADENGPLLRYEDLGPWPIPPGAVRAARVVIDGLGLDPEPRLVAWDDQRSTVRSIDGRLEWYADASHQAYPRAGEIVIEDQATHPFPRGNRSMSALLVRSLEDLIETVNAEEVTAIDEDGTIHIYGHHDNSGGQVVRFEDTGVVARASGTQGSAPWSVEVLATRLITESSGLLNPTDVAPPPI